MATRVGHGSRRLVGAAVTFALVGLVTSVGGVLLATGSSAVAPVDDPCVPVDAYTQTTDWITDSPGEGWYVLDERTVVDQEATYQETGWVPGSPGEGWVQFDERTVDGALVEEAHWQRYSLNGPWESEAEPPPFPDPRWQPNVQGDPHGVGVEGAYYRSHGGSGGGDWFYLEWVEAVHEQVTEYRYYLETTEVSHVEYVWAFDHAAVTCTDEPGGPEEPVVLGEEGVTPDESPPEVLGAQATAGADPVPRAVDAGVTGTTSGGIRAPLLVGSGLVLLVAAGASLAAARRRDAS